MLLCLHEIPLKPVLEFKDFRSSNIQQQGEEEQKWK